MATQYSGAWSNRENHIRWRKRRLHLIELRELFLFLHCLFPDPINNNITSCWQGMLLQYRGQACLSKDAKKRCYQTALMMLTCPRDRSTGPGPPLYLALLPWPLLSTIPYPQRAFCLFFLSDTLITRGINLHFSVPATIVNSWAKKATQTSHLFWGAPTKNVILS